MTMHFANLGEEIAHESDYGTAGPRNFHARCGKRVLDVTLILISAPIVLPVIAMLALMIWSCDRGTPFYRQARLGKDGRIFTMWKLRTMVRDADIQLERYLDANPGAREEWTTKQKLMNDPRVIRIGALLRKTSLDELPQLFNVLRGDMSLVGPRPMMPHQRAAYPGSSYERLRPGLTGPWQISDRNDCAFSGRAIFDTSYENHLSFRTDLRILVRTVSVVLRGTGC